MTPLFIYLLKANIALTLFYLSYRYGLRHLTFYILNRCFLLFGIIFSAAFPLIDISAFFQKHEQLTGSVIYYMPDFSSLQTGWSGIFSIWNIATCVFWTGVIVMTIRFITQLISLIRIHISAATIKIGEDDVKCVQQRINPFSFFNNIYINPSLHAAGDLESVLWHEKVHVRQWHTADVLIGELNNIFYWFNPGAWLMKSAIRENLEFIADKTVLQDGMDAKSYQYSLVKISNMPHAGQLANNFNFSHLKSRIVMMNKKRSSRVNFVKYLLLLPLIIGVTLIFNISKGAYKAPDNIHNIQADAVSADSPGNRMLSPEDTSHLPVNMQNFLGRNPTVKALGWGSPVNKKAGTLLVFLWNNSTETYDLNDPQEMKIARTKYGKLPSSPPPPPKVIKDSTIVPRLHPKVKFTPPRIIKDSATPPPKMKYVSFKVVNDSVAHPLKVKFTPPRIIKDSVTHPPKVRYTPPRIIKDSVVAPSTSAVPIAPASPLPPAKSVKGITITPVNRGSSKAITIAGAGTS